MSEISRREFVGGLAAMAAASVPVTAGPNQTRSRRHKRCFSEHRGSISIPIRACSH